MDNADLEKLSVSPGKLTPKFHPNTTEYSVTLASDVSQIKIDPLTSDSGASYSISGSGGGKTVPLKEGEVTPVKIEVTAEDGSTIKNYFIHVTRLSASDASLTDLKLSVGTLSPNFASNITSYSTFVPFSCSSVEVTPVVADKKTAVKVNGSESKEPTALNYGDTVVEVEVTSPDASNKRTYVLVISRLKLPRPIKFSDENRQLTFQCPVCLGVLYRPKSIKDSQPNHVFCKGCIDELTRTSKQDPLDGSPLASVWRVDEYDLDKDLSSQMVFCVHKYWGCGAELKLCDLGPHVEQCEYRPVAVEKSGEVVPAKDLEEKSKEACKGCPDCNRPVRSSELEEHKTYMCTSRHTNTGIKHKSEIRAWEKKLQQETSEKYADKLVKTAEEQINECFKVLPQHGNAGHFDGEVSPLRYLEMAAEWLATAIKLSPKKADLHFQLGQVLEEQHYVQDVYGIKPTKSSDDEEMDFNMKSKESSKEDDIQAICEMRGAGRNAPLSLQLKAIDEEYHYLLDQGQSDKADYVQKLYAWKSKQATQNKTAQQATNEEEPLGKAYLKYLDALSNGADNHMYNLHVGRMLLLQSKPEEAVSRLQVAVGLKPTNIDARFYLGFALCKQKDGPGKRKEEAVKYLSEGIEHLLNQMSTDANDPSKDPEKWQQTTLSSINLLRPDNVQWLQGCAFLGNLCKQMTTPPSGVMSTDDALHTSAMLASHVLSRLVARGETYHQVEWVLYETHFTLLQTKLGDAKGKGNQKNGEISSFCENLSGLLNCSTIPPGKQILELKEKTCQQGVLLQSCNSRALYRLGDAQLSLYDNDDPTSANAKQILQDAELSYRTSIEQEGSPSVGGEAPAKITEQRWFKERTAKKEAEKKAVAAGGTPQKTASAAAGKAASPAVRGGTRAARGSSTPTRGGAATRGRGSTPSTRGGATAAAKAPAGGTRGRTSPTKPAGTAGRGVSRGGSTAAASKASAAASKPPTSTPSAHKSGACSPTKQPTSSKQSSQAKTGAQSPAAPSTPVKPAEPSPATEQKPSGPPNKPSYNARLGLARVLMRKGGDSISEAHKLYEEVISMATAVHDAYIELADSLIKTDPMKAVDTYSKYPFKEPLTFDDAYIYGEMVRLLMKNEKYDDPRLGPSMISLGKVMGLTVLEKYVETLDKTFKYSKLLMQVYAGVHGKSVDDPDLQQFFKFKCWV